MPDEPDVTVFISYRRADTSADAGRLYDALRRRFGRDSVFMDVDSIRPGQDWVDAVEDAVGRCDALLALIGPDWSDVRDDSGNRRLEDEFDRVRLEIEAALKSDKAVIPVLFENAHMPAASELPESLRPLVRRNATRLSHASFENDLRGLLRALKTIARAKAPARAPAATAPVIEPALPVIAAPPPAVAAPPPAVAAPTPVAAPPPVAPGPYYPAAQQGPPPPAAVYSPPAQPYPGGARRGGGNTPLLLLGSGLIALVVIGLLAWALLGQQAATPTLSPSPPPTPTGFITPAPTDMPQPSEAPTVAPTDAPTTSPTPAPTEPPTGAPLDFRLAPTYGEVSLDPGFAGDPYSVALDAGGSTDVRYLGGSCVGYAATAPDYRINYGQGSSTLLRFYFISDADTTLIINDTNGAWHCADDTFGTLNPTLDFASPPAGEYDIWVGTIQGDIVQGTLHVTELANNHP